MSRYVAAPRRGRDAILVLRLLGVSFQVLASARISPINGSASAIWVHPLDIGIRAPVGSPSKPTLTIIHFNGSKKDI